MRLVSLLLLAACGSSAPPPAAPSLPPGPPGTCTVGVEVVDADGKPVFGANVTFQPGDIKLMTDDKGRLLRDEPAPPTRIEVLQKVAGVGTIAFTPAMCGHAQTVRLVPPPAE